MARSSELSRVALLKAALGTGDPRVLLGIGDDAATLGSPGEPLVWTVDAAVEGVHFRRDWMSLEDVGYRATMAAASDLAAMGATPLGLLAGLIVPTSFEDHELQELARGQRQAADAIGAPLVGGNLARGSELSITTTALGHAARPLRRDGARAGDVVAIAGPIGWAGAGLIAASRGVENAKVATMLSAFRRPVAHIAAGISARSVAHAAIDLSDGLAHDLAQIARASGVSAELAASSLVDPALRAAAGELGIDPLEQALHGGEDYALLIALPPDLALPGFSAIGRFVARAGADVLLVAADGSRSPIEARGFDHFADATR